MAGKVNEFAQLGPENLHLELKTLNRRKTLPLTFEHRQLILIFFYILLFCNCSLSEYRASKSSLGQMGRIIGSPLPESNSSCAEKVPIPTYTTSGGHA